jgi:hypothetical protein
MRTPLPVLAFTGYPDKTNARCTENLTKQTLEQISLPRISYVFTVEKRRSPFSESINISFVTTDYKNVSMNETKSAVRIHVRVGPHYLLLVIRGGPSEESAKSANSCHRRRVMIEIPPC